MQYDPIKQGLGKVFNSSTFMRKLFYRLLDILLLRGWHIRKHLRNWLNANEHKLKVLDAGSGFGQYVYYLTRKKPELEILGVDVKQEQIDDCNRFFKRIKAKNVRFELADLTTLAPVELYDLILCVDVMEHIEQDRLVLTNFYKTLHKGGMLIISTPSDQGGSDVHHHSEHDTAVGFIDEHVRDGYSVTDLDEKLRAAGFEKTEIHYQYGKPGKFSWKLSMKYPILMLNKTRLFFILLPFYYVLVFPLSLILNYIDLIIRHKTGTGLVARAWK